MAIWPFTFRPLPGRFANMLEFTDTVIGTGGTSVANSTTTTVIIPTPFTKSYVDRISLAAITPAGSAGTVTVQFFKQSGATKTALTATTSVKSDFITGANPATYQVNITASDIVRLVQPGDVLLVDVVASGTITTQPTVSLQSVFSVIS